MVEDTPIGANEICFGFDRPTDEHSLALFLKLFSRNQLLATLIPRLDDAEIEQTVNVLTGLMHNHLQEKEYHELFLGDHEHHH
jgi:TorA maturation chaperone TorD